MKLSAIFKQTLNESDWADEHDRLTKQAIQDWCKQARIRNYSLSKDGNDYVIDANEDVRLYANDLPLDDDNKCYLPYRFGEVNGNFIILTNNREKLASLKNGPYMVNGNYVARHLQLETLEGGPSSVNNEFDVSNNQLKSWDGIPSQCGRLIIHHNKIPSFTGISKHWTMGSELSCDAIDRGVLELLEIEGLDDVLFRHDFGGTSAAAEVDKANRIINHHLKGDRDVFDLQSDLLDADLGEWIKR